MAGFETAPGRISVEKLKKALYSIALKND